MNRKGFTLMELLIVIGILGILAAGLLAAIDPFEQLAKARDTNNRNAAIELLSGAQRYYATNNMMPWAKDGKCAKSGSILKLQSKSEGNTDQTITKTNPEGRNVVEMTDTDLKTCLEKTLIEDTGELKDTFFTVSLTGMYIASGELSRAIVCFNPTSKAERNRVATKFYCPDATTGQLVLETTEKPCGDVDTRLQCFQ